VDFAVYTVPHPAENKMNFRIQGKENSNIVDLFFEGVQYFSNWCEEASKIFDQAVETFQNKAK
jgi:DNA-directed RNA polymerase subunit L